MKNIEIIGSFRLAKYSYEGYIGATSLTSGFTFGFNPYTQQAYTSFQPNDVAVMVTTSGVTTASPGWVNIYTTSQANATSLKLWKKELTVADTSTSATWTSASGFNYEFMHGFVFRTTSGGSGLYAPNSAIEYAFTWNGTPAFYNPSNPLDYSDYYTVPAPAKSAFDGSDQYQRVDFYFGTSSSGAYSSGSFGDVLPPNNIGFYSYWDRTEVNMLPLTLATDISTRPYSFDNNVYFYYGSFVSQFLIHSTANLAGTSIVWRPDRYQTFANVGTLTFWIRRKSTGGGVLL